MIHLSLGLLGRQSIKTVRFGSLFSFFVKKITFSQNLRFINRHTVTYSPMDSFDALPPNAYDITLTDINEESLKKLGKSVGVQHLSPAEFPSSSFPAQGIIYGLNYRLMISLVCHPRTKLGSPINVWFLVDTGSGHTFLARKTVEALIGSHDVLAERNIVAIQDPNSAIECYASPIDKHFSDVNILGMGAANDLGLSIDIDWKNKLFQLTKK